MSIFQKTLEKGRGSFLQGHDRRAGGPRVFRSEGKRSLDARVPTGHLEGPQRLQRARSLLSGLAVPNWHGKPVFPIRATDSDGFGRPGSFWTGYVWIIAGVLTLIGILGGLQAAFAVAAALAIFTLLLALFLEHTDLYK